MKQKIKSYIRKWESQGYPEGIPDEAPHRLEHLNKVGSYRQICIAIMKNDFALKSLGFNRETCLAYQTLKRQELIQRGKISEPLDTQRKMF